MGQGVTKPFIDAQKEAALRSRLADMKAMKVQRDAQLSTQIAIARDRVMCVEPPLLYCSHCGERVFDY